MLKANTDKARKAQPGIIEKEEEEDNGQVCIHWTAEEAYHDWKEHPHISSQVASRGQKGKIEKIEKNVKSIQSASDIQRKEIFQKKGHESTVSCWPIRK